LAFFLNRAWLLAKGIARALQEDDDAEFDRLMWMPPITKVDELRVVTIGIVKKVAAGAFCAFEFRLRSVDDGRSLIWSSVFPLKSGTSIPPEGFLHIPQKQKFTASIFLERKVVTLRDVGVMGGDNETGRIQLRDESTVTTGDELDDWDRFLQWDVAPAVERIQKHQPGPFDLDVEFQEEVVLSDWDISSPESRDDGKSSYPITVHGVVFNGQVSDGIEGKATHKALKNMINARQKPLLYGLMHYESCHLVLQPLAFFTDDGPEYITISQEAIDRKALLQTIKFT
ncbi:MAG: hypothetical protein KDA52_06870, partial [Planctomycetaceae bacterium]|nr:hypothetical protein [Planctomycetaceae bacterium]